MRSNRKIFKEKPLYVRVNTTCHGGKKFYDNIYKFKRGAKNPENEKMKSGNQFHGLDFTPLYGFLRKNVGKKWNDVKAKAISRLPNDLKYNPFEWVVLTNNEWLNIDKDSLSGAFSVGTSTSFSQLYIDDLGCLQLVNPNFTANDLNIHCGCCTYTFNGKKASKKFIQHS